MKTEYEQEEAKKLVWWLKIERLSLKANDVFEKLANVPDQSAYHSRQLYTYNFKIVKRSSKSAFNRDNTFI